MVIIEIQQKPQNWIAAVYRNAQDGENYMKTLSDNVLQQVKIHVQDLDFPVYAIETFTDGHNQFSFTDHEGLVNIIRSQKKLLTYVDGYVYFTFYEFEEDYFQEDTTKSQMGALEHTHVDNDYLEEEELSRSTSFDAIRKVEYHYDIEQLDALYNQLMENNASEYEKEELATQGYMKLFRQMNDDFACGKLDDSFIGSLLHLVEQAERLRGKR